MIPTDPAFAHRVLFFNSPRTTGQKQIDGAGRQLLTLVFEGRVCTMTRKRSSADTLRDEPAVDGYLSFFSLFASISNSRFSPPNSAEPFPLSLSPPIVSL